MPGNVAASAPTTVLPQSLCTAFTRMGEFPMLTVRYHDGTTERGLITDGVNAATSIKSWKLSQRLAVANLTTLRTFYNNQQGKPFFMYDPFDCAPGTKVGSNYDATGSSTQGRYTVYFTSQQWSETCDIARANTDFSMRECS